jgi:SAM-dependent methyltransferase
VHRSGRIDYDEIAHHYERHRWAAVEVVRELVNVSGVGADSTVLDVGCGTGTASVAFQERTGATVWAVDRSVEMLRYGRGKSSPVRFARADAHRLPFRDARFDFAYAVLIIHHLVDVPGFFRELYRVIREGKAAILTCSHDWIGRHPMTRFFPSFAEIDLARFPPLSFVRQWLSDAGFATVEEIPVRTADYVADEDYVKRVADKWVSTLQLIPEAEFQQGLQKLRQTVRDGATSELQVHWEGVLVTALKR